MAIDIRANATCSLGPLISASVTDDYLQGSGVIKTRGTAEINGLFMPAVGTTVTFGYAGPGGGGTIPRSLRVISCAADPYRSTTSVELGCALTYFANRKPPPTVNPNTKDPAANGTTPCYVFSFATLPISASYVLQFCADKLGLTLSSNPLTNKFSVDEFDLSPGYVQVIGDLLISEGYFGMVRSGSTLQIISLDGDSGGTTGPVITDEDVIDLGAVGVGSLPGESVKVNYNSLRLRPPEVSSDPATFGAIGGQRNWESAETRGPFLPVSVTYQQEDGTSVTENASFASYSRSFSRYDSKDRLIETVTTNMQSSAQVNGQWASDIASVGGAWNVPCYSITHVQLRHKTVYDSAPLSGGSLLTLAQTKTTEEVAAAMNDRILADTGPASECIVNITTSGYDDSVVLSQTTRTYASPLQVAGSINGARFKSDDGGTYTVGTGATVLQSVETILYDKDRSSGITKTVTDRYMIGAGTIGGQQGLAGASQLTVDPATSESLSTSMGQLLAIASQLHPQGAETQIRTEREYGLQRRPSQAERNNSANAKDTGSQSAQVQWEVGSAETASAVELTLPYTPDDAISWNGTEYEVTASDAEEKARAEEAARLKAEADAEAERRQRAQRELEERERLQEIMQQVHARRRAVG
jgi:hypothetical protein